MNGSQIQFHGNLTRDPEQRYTDANGTPFARLGVAVNTRRRGEEEPVETIFYDVDLWGSAGEYALRNCRKGQLVFVQGMYSFRQYTRRDGTTGHSHQVSAREFEAFNRSGGARAMDEQPPEAGDAPYEDEPADPAPEPAEQDAPYESEDEPELC